MTARFRPPVTELALAAGNAPNLKKDPLMKAESTPHSPDYGSPVVEFENVTKVYDDGTVGLENATTSILTGEFVFLVGPTGCGKSTMIRLLTKELEATDGSLYIAGRDIVRLKPDRVPYLRRNIGTVFQDFKLLPNRTVYDNVAYSLLVTGAKRAEIRQKVPHILQLVGLSTKLHNYPDQLSGGEQQRVSIARAFVNHPPLLICDEPTGNLDPETSLGIMQLIYRINRTGTTVILATHDKVMVDRMRRRVIELKGGHIVRDERASGYTQDFAAIDDAVHEGKITANMPTRETGSHRTARPR
jgi:cell division transport system ATP-binding protein